MVFIKQLGPPLFTSVGLVLMAAALVACHDDDCDDGLFETAPGQADQIGYRNPETGACETFGGPRGPGGGCGDDFGTALEEAPQQPPDFAFCGECEQNDEITCVETDTCRAIYNSDDQFVDCWGTAPSGPISGLECDGLDAYSCSQTDHCSATHDDNGFFFACVDEKRACSSSSDCGGNDTCSTENGECLQGPGCSLGGPCDDGCYGFCEGPGQIDPGSCTGEPACDEVEPACPVGTVAGRDENCWTGFCIPIEACPSGAECSSLSEPECAQANNCAGIYAGENCMCDGTSCSCESYRYEGCGDL